MELQLAKEGKHLVTGISFDNVVKGFFGVAAWASYNEEESTEEIHEYIVFNDDLPGSDPVGIIIDNEDVDHLEVHSWFDMDEMITN